MPQDDLAHDLDGSAGSRGVRGRVPSQIMRSHLDAYPVARPFHHVPGSAVLDREYLIYGFLVQGVSTGILGGPEEFP
jgi:hypothetical protein